MLDACLHRPWLAHYDPQVPPRLRYDNVPLYTFLERAAERYPKRLAVRFHNWSATYAQFKMLVDFAAAHLKSLGVRHGDRVAIMLPNSPQALISYWASLKLGAVVVMTNPLYMEKELLHHFTDAGASTLITLDLLWTRIAPLRPRLPGLIRVIVTSMADCLGFPLNLLYRWKTRRQQPVSPIPYDGQSVLPWKELLRRTTPDPAHSVNPHRDMALLQYTGGTTGLPKGAMLTHANLSANAQQCRAILHAVGDHGEVMLGVLPFFHIYGLTVCVNFGTLIGATLLPLPRFDPRETLQTIHNSKPTIFPCAPSIFIAMLQQKKLERYDLSSIRYCISGSAPMPVAVMERFQQLTGAHIVEGYGLTEASPVTHLNPLHGRGKPGSIGVPFPDTDAVIVDMEVGTIPLPPGKIGELVIRGPQVMHGYWKRPDETASTLRNGWLYTGDIATMDEDGYFYIVDRKKDLIITGGYNVYPREIDEVLHEHPAVREAVTVGVPHATRGEIIKAYIVLKEGHSATKADILAFCRQKLASYKVPKQIEFRDELPKTLVGKVLRRALREEETRRGPNTAELEE